ncbi:MAG TPA: PAS domain-containing protein [Aliidongia sp.]|uniref:PAS domain-containing protein n=1 Tax=Aliidongia sp. TaxID=1914230 RepID=UPI002DDD74F2|nr:PAS domain-containing protein [Aliidongia sp.]HEV2673793.1 PAS domain-containing protein [Aliidongia sp.]
MAETAQPVLDRLRSMGGPLFDAIAQSGMAVVVSGPFVQDCPIVYVNDAFRRLTGYTADEAIGRNCRFLQGADTDPDAVARIRQALETGTEISVDLLNRRKDGTPFWNRLHVAPVRDADDVVQFFLSTQVDISSERAADTVREQLSASRRELAGLQDRLRIVRTVQGVAGAWEWDIPADRLYGDARFASLCCLDPAAAAAGLPTTAFFDAIHPGDRARVRIAIAGIVNGAEVFAKDYRIVAPDGAVAWISARGRTHLNDQDEPVRFSGVLSDITQQRRVEDRLRVAQTAGGVGTFEYLGGLGTADVSGQFCKLLGLRETDTLPVRTINSVVHPDDPPIIDNLSDRLVGPSFREFRIIRADTGETRWMARRGESARDGETSKVHFVGVIYDVTASKLAEERLRDLADTLEERVRERTRERDRVWTLSQDLFNVCDFDGIQRAVNPAWRTVLGYGDAELVGSRLDALIHPEDLAAASEHFAALTHMKASRDFDCRLRHRNGTYRWINWTAIPEGDVFYSIGRDITHRKQLEDLLRQSQKMEAVGQLTGGLAHDFNNMLMGIMGGMEIMRRRIADGKTHDLGRLIEMALSSAERAAALTHRLLAFSRRQSLDSRALDVNGLVTSIEDLLRRTLGERVAIALDLAEDAWTAIGDTNQLESAILNLAINARDAMPDGGRLTIGTVNVRLVQDTTGDHGELAPGDYIKITVADTGMGMAPEVVRRAFEPFYTTKPIGQGTGLGLSMVYGFAQQSNGHVAIDSRLGIGTTISLYLPRFKAVLEEPGSEELTESPRGDGETVLVIEDDEIVRELVIEVLDELGYAAVEARNGDEAIAILKSSQSLDLMVSDAGLPGLNGRQIASIAREHRPGLQILFMTGYAADAVDRPNFLGPGMDLILKPFSVDAIAVRIRSIIERR